jgi:putative endonuclease
MPKVFTSKSQKTGEIGEHLAVRYLENKGFSIIERNYTKKWGEIDVIGIKDKVLHFVEVKSKSGQGIGYRPEENIHSAKIQRLKRTIQTYLLENDTEAVWQFDIAVVYIDLSSKEARVKILENIIL